MINIKLEDEDLMKIIHKRLNYEFDVDKNIQPIKYDGFDMSGFNHATIHNIGLLSRFEDIMIKDMDDSRKIFMFIPMFWKGGGNIIRVTEINDLNLESKTIEADIGGQSTDEIMLKLIKFNMNPN